LLRYINRAAGVNFSFLPHTIFFFLHPLPLALHRRTKEQRRNTAADLLHAGADARRLPTPSSTMPPPLLSVTLLGDWIFLCTLAAVTPPLHKLR
jgi:hypothetical protein